jgi:hypothetical protein
MAENYFTASYSADTEPYFKSLLGRAQAVSTEDWQPYEGERYAQFTPDQLAYMQAVGDLEQDPRTRAAAARTQAGIAALYGQEYKPTEFTADAINPRALQQLQMGRGQGIAAPKDYRSQINAAKAAQGTYGQQLQNYLLGVGQSVSGAGDFRSEINRGQAAQGVYNQQLQNYLLGAGQRIQAPEEWEAAKATAQQGTYNQQIQNYLLGAGQRIEAPEDYRGEINKAVAAQAQYDEDLKNFGIARLADIQAPQNLAQNAARMQAAQTGFQGGICPPICRTWWLFSSAKHSAKLILKPKHEQRGRYRQELLVVPDKQ